MESSNSESSNSDDIGIVYLLHAIGSRRYKIGQTKRSVRDRIVEIGTPQQPFEIVERHSVQCYSPKKVETELHKMFAKHRARGEWFDLPDKKVWKLIELMNDESIQEILFCTKNLANYHTYKIISLLTNAVENEKSDESFWFQKHCDVLISQLLCLKKKPTIETISKTIHSLPKTYLECILNSCEFQISAPQKRLYPFTVEAGLLYGNEKNNSLLENIIITAFLNLSVEIFDREGELFYKDLLDEDARLNRNKIKQEIKAIAFDANERGLLHEQRDNYQDTDTFAASGVINLIEEYAFLYPAE